jgi:acyl-coenzyme A thioesterase PaaI-like protein
MSVSVEGTYQRYQPVICRRVSDFDWVADALDSGVPWVHSSGVVVDEVEATRAVCRLPDRPELHNHVGGPHAAMIFGLAETASGAVGLAAFGATAERAVPLVVTSTIHYRALARGPLTAEAVLARPAAEVLAELDAGTRPEFTVDVTVRDGQGKDCATVTVVWTLKPVRDRASAPQGD